MPIIDYQTAVDAAHHAGLGEDAVYTAYSGRGMFGAECLAIAITNEGQAFRFVRELIEADGSIEDTLLDDQSRDSVGEDVLVYWRRIQVSGADADEED